MRSSFLAFFLFVLLFLMPNAAHADEQWYLEFLEPGLEESLVRRAVALELREISILGDPGRGEGDQEEISLHIRVAREDEKLYVSLWDRGEFVGRRRVSDSAHSRVLARRVGLAVGELGRRLSGRRTRAARLLERSELLAQQKLDQEKLLAQRRALSLRPSFGALMIPQGGWLMGPSLGVAFNEHYPLRFSSELNWMVGGLPALSGGHPSGGSPTWSQFEFLLGADYVLETSSQTEVSLGALLAIAALHLGGGVEADGIEGQSDTWSARLGARLGTSRKLSRDLRARIDLSAGTLLRRVPLKRGREEVSVAGGFLGLTLSASLVPYFSR